VLTSGGTTIPAGIDVGGGGGGVGHDEQAAVWGMRSGRRRGRREGAEEEERSPARKRGCRRREGAGDGRALDGAGRDRGVAGWRPMEGDLEGTVADSNYLEG
jgi:hypothetical protein